jgi:hypothetical protein
MAEEFVAVGCNDMVLFWRVDVSKASINGQYRF